MDGPPRANGQWSEAPLGSAPGEAFRREDPRPQKLLRVLPRARPVSSKAEPASPRCPPALAAVPCPLVVQRRIFTVVRGPLAQRVRGGGMTRGRSAGRGTAEMRRGHPERRDPHGRT